MSQSRGGLSGRSWTVMLAIPILLAMAAAPTTLSSARLDQVTRCLVFAVALCGLQLLVGGTGSICLGHGALFAVGAYTEMVLVVRHDGDPLMSMGAAVFAGAVAGLLLGIAATRIRGIGLALLTVTIGIGWPALVTRLGSVTGGSNGLAATRTQVMAPRWTGAHGLDVTIFHYWLAAVLAIAVIVAAVTLAAGGPGRMMAMAREHPRTAIATGIAPAWVRLFAFVSAGAVTSVAGAAYALQARSIGPGSFDLELGFTMLAALLIGGLGTSTLAGGSSNGGLGLRGQGSIEGRAGRALGASLGPLVGGAIMVWLPYAAAHQAQRLHRPDLANLLLALVVLVMVRVAPNGVVGLVGSAVTGLRRCRTRNVTLPVITIGEASGRQHR